MSVATSSGSASVVTIDSCPLCGSRDLRAAFTEDPYTVMRCGSCGLGFVTPRLDESGLVGIYTAESYWTSDSPKTQGYHDYRADEPLYLKTFRKRLGYALRSGVGGDGIMRALDVGCAAGFCMAALRERGFEVHGVEVSEAIGSHARDHFGFGDNVFIGTLEDSPHAERSFDLICMWDVVEHVPDPRALLAKAYSLLKPGGLLVIETQDIDSRFAQTLGPKWHHFKHAEHIYHFTPATVTELVRTAGFHPDRLTHRYGGKYVSFQFIAERAGRVHPLISKALAPLARVQNAALYLNFMDEMIVTARRPAA
ncbi:MAG: class I SAM-dependent methyltransferase [Solirubrobacteraceae bacterium]